MTKPVLWAKKDSYSRARANGETNTNTGQEINNSWMFVPTTGSLLVKGEFSQTDLIDVYAPGLGYVGEYNRVTGDFDLARNDFTLDSTLMNFLHGRLGGFGPQMRTVMLARNSEFRNDVVMTAGGELVGLAVAAWWTARTAAPVISDAVWTVAREPKVHWPQEEQRPPLTRHFTTRSAELFLRSSAKAFVRVPMRRQPER